VTDDLALMQRDDVGDAVVVRLSGEIDLSNAEELHRQIRQTVGDAPLVVVDLTGIAYIDSQGLRLLKRLSDQLDDDGARLEVVAPPDCIARDVLELTGMGEDITIRDAFAG
jgi:anti-sigma B factor antagonist